MLMADTNLTAQSATAAVPAVKGTHSTTGEGIVGASVGGTGVHGTSESAFGVLGESKTGRGVVASSDSNYGLRAASRTSAGIRGSSVEGRGVEGWATKAEGVVGISTTGNGVWGQTEGAGVGVLGTSKSGVGVHGTSTSAAGVHGESKSGRGVVAISDSDYGLRAASTKSAGIRGSSVEGRGVEGWATNSEGVVGISTSGTGVWGQTEGAGIGVAGSSKSGIGVHGKGGRLAALFEGDVEVTGDIRLTNADCAEEFDVVDGDVSGPGTVMVLTDDGSLTQSDRPHDKRVAGVISGAGEYRPGLVLDKRQTMRARRPVALLGKVYCKVDAQYAPVEVGDLLTTSATPGHAMKAGDPTLAFGTVIGKALRPLKTGQALIPILIALQ
jgi:hypothetical protein